MKYQVKLNFICENKLITPIGVSDNIKIDTEDPEGYTNELSVTKGSLSKLSSDYKLIKTKKGDYYRLINISKTIIVPDMSSSMVSFSMVSRTPELNIEYKKVTIPVINYDNPPNRLDLVTAILYSRSDKYGDDQMKVAYNEAKKLIKYIDTVKWLNEQ